MHPWYQEQKQGGLKSGREREKQEKRWGRCGINGGHTVVLNPRYKLQGQYQTGQMLVLFLKRIVKFRTVTYAGQYNNLPPLVLPPQFVLGFS